MPSKTDKIVLVGSAVATAGIIGLIGFTKLVQPGGVPRVAAPAVGLFTQTINLIDPPYINTGTIVVVENKTDQTVPPLDFQNITGTSIPSLHLTAIGFLGAKVDGYAYLSLDLTRFKPAKISLVAIEALARYFAVDGHLPVGDIANANPMQVNIWDQNGVPPTPQYGNNWMTCTTGAPYKCIFSGNVTPGAMQQQQNIDFRFTPTIDISNLTALVLAPSMNVIGDAAGAEAWIAPLNVQIQVTPLVTVTVNIETDGGILLSGVPVTVIVYNSIGTIAAQGSTTTGTISFANLEADSFNVYITVGTRSLNSGYFALPSGTGLATFTVLHPVPVFTVSPSPAQAGQIVTLDPTGTSDPQGSITSQTWLVQSDSTIVFSESLSPTSSSFLKPVSYMTPAGSAIESIHLGVGNDAGLASTAFHSETVTNFGFLQLTVTDDVGNLYSSVEVDLYDSTNTLVAKALTNAQGVASLTVLPGNYTAKAKLALDGAPGITKSVSITITSGITTSASLTWSHPTAAFSWLTSAGVTDVGFGVAVSGSASISGDSSDLTIFYARYDWGDGSSNDTTNTGNLLSTAVHIYSVQTATAIALTVVNDAGLQNVVRHAITVNSAVVASLTASVNPKATVPVTVTATPTGGTPPYTYGVWDWGDGTKSVFGAPSPQSHTYQNAGTYLISVTVFDAVSGIIATLSLMVAPAIIPQASRVYPAKITYTSAPAVFTVEGVLSLNATIFGDGFDSISNVVAEQQAYNSTPGGTGLYDIAEDFGNIGLVDIASISLVQQNYNKSVPIQFLDNQSVEVQVYSPLSGGWLSLGSSSTGPASIPFRSKTYAETLAAHGVFQFISLSVPSDVTMYRFVFAGNGGLLPSTSAAFGISQPLR